MDIQTCIEQSPWLKQYCQAMPKRFLAKMEICQIEENKRLITKGENNPYVYLMYNGSLRIINEFDNNRIFAYAAKEAPGFSGLLELLSGQEKATSTVMTICPSSFIRMHKTAFAQWMEEDVHAFRLVVKAFANQLYPAFFSMGSAHVYPKYIILLQYLAKTYAPQLKKCSHVVVKDTREELAEELGLSLRTIYRLCSQLVEDGMGVIVKKKIHLDQHHMHQITTYLENYSYEQLS
ncbi:Crp/Fnr family transcriptional regulator [Sphaerochaeta sp.]|jgi:CRP/FNR family cyclic AMP-dependent transcriptional regulator|uniref:Crp/Fnr family transcriptional regulator n=1 Tax=Sphaerochaeta sp. TaxID=1972642 RepID=UPI002FCB54F7